jgi:hypothetical protein
LAFVPKSDVFHGFNLIKAKCSKKKFSKFIKYFERNFIGALVAGSKTTRKRPRYPIELWNVNERVNEEMKRSNNNMEAWHQQFEMSGRRNPTFFRLVNMFREEQNRTEKKLSEIDAGKRNIGYTEKELRIFVLVKEYKKAKILEFFNNMITNLKD